MKINFTSFTSIWIEANVTMQGHKKDDTICFICTITPTSVPAGDSFMNYGYYCIQINGALVKR